METYLYDVNGNSFVFDIVEDDAKKGYHSGVCDDDIAKLMELPYIKAQINAVSVEDMMSILDEYGCEFDEEDVEDIKSIVLWLACGNIVEDAYEQENKKRMD